MASNYLHQVAPSAQKSVFAVVVLAYWMKLNWSNVCWFYSSSRPTVRALPSKEMFEHMLKRHNVLFVYVGGESPLKVSFVHVGQTHVGSLRTTRVPTVRLIDSAGLLASVLQQSWCASLSISAFAWFKSERAFCFCRRSTATWPPSSSFTLISSRPQSKFFQRQVWKYILFNMNTELNVPFVCK